MRINVIRRTVLGNHPIFDGEVCLFLELVMLSSALSVHLIEKYEL